jgi:hypothetical protein
MGKKANNEELDQAAVGGGAAAGGQAGAAAGGQPQGGGRSQTGAPLEPELKPKQPAVGAVATEKPLSGGGGEAEPSPQAVGLPEGVSLERYSAALAQQVEKKVREEYEGKSGHLSKLRQKYEQKLREAQAGQAASAQRAMEYAAQMADRDPEQAIQVLAQQLQAYQERDQRSVAEGEISHWAESIIGELDLDVEDEDVQALFDEIGPMTSRDTQFEFLGRATQISNARLKRRAEAAGKKLQEFEKDLGQRVSQLVATALVERGAQRVETSDRARKISRT